MGIYDMIDEYKSNELYIREKEDAMNYFVKQKQAIDWIRDTKWFMEIRNYRSRVEKNCNERLKTIKTEDIKKLQWELIAATEFLTFLDNILLQDLSKEDLDILTH